MARDNTVLERGLLPDLALRGEGFTTAFHYAPGRAHTLWAVTSATWCAARTAASMW